MKKMFSLALALIMALALCVPAFAATDDGEKTITIANSIKDETYTAYKIFDLTKAEGAVAGVGGKGYAYTINEDSQFFAAIVKYAESNPGLTLEKTTEGNKWNVIPAETLNAATFAAYLNDFVLNTKELKADGSVTAQDVGATITVKGAGYYFVDSTLGALCALDTADAVTVYEKNSVPTIIKEVKEDSNEEWGAMADADYMQKVDYRLTVNTGTAKVAKVENPVEPDSAVGNQTGVDEDYVITDSIPAGLYFDNASVKVTAAGTEWKLKENYAVDTAVNFNDATTTVTFTLDGASVAALGQDANIVIEYTVEVRTNVVVGDDGNTNIAVLTYKEQTSQDAATVYTWALPIYKFTKNEAGEQVNLANAKFTLHKVTDEGAVYAVANKNGDDYNFSSWIADSEKATVFESPDDGEFVVYGLDADTYVLTETEAPAGYNALTEPITIVIESEDDGSEYAFALTHEIKVDDTAVTRVEVLNNTGTELPSTGGIGTTIFYTVGGLMMAAAVVLFVTKKKLAVQE